MEASTPGKIIMPEKKELTEEEKTKLLEAEFGMHEVHAKIPPATKGPPPELDDEDVALCQPPGNISVAGIALNKGARMLEHRAATVSEDSSLDDLPPFMRKAKKVEAKKA